MFVLTISPARVCVWGKGKKQALLGSWSRFAFSRRHFLCKCGYHKLVICPVDWESCKPALEPWGCNWNYIGRWGTRAVPSLFPNKSHIPWPRSWKRCLNSQCEDQIRFTCCFSGPVSVSAVNFMLVLVRLSPTSCLASLNLELFPEGGQCTRTQAASPHPVQDLGHTSNSVNKI